MQKKTKIKNINIVLIDITVPYTSSKADSSTKPCVCEMCKPLNLLYCTVLYCTVLYYSNFIHCTNSDVLIG